MLRTRSDEDETTRARLAVAVVLLFVGSTVAVGVAFPTGLAAAQETAAPAQGTVSLADADGVVTGETENETLGRSMAVGDVNGDGVPDLLVGAPQADVERDGNVTQDAGAVYVFYGPVANGDRSAEDADARLLGRYPYDWAGFDVAAGDVDGDGDDDVVVGAPLYDRMGNRTGAAYVVEGGANLSGTVNLSDEAGVLEGVESDDVAGRSVAAGDVNGDDVAEVVVGAPFNDEGGEDAGTVYVVSNASFGGNASLADVDLRLTGEGTGDKAGFAVDAGDGALVVGAPRNDAAGNNSGAAYFVSESALADASGALALSDVSTTMRGAGAEDYAGWAVDVADVDGDGALDAVVGAPFNNSTATNAGAAYVVAGAADGSRETSLADADATYRGASPAAYAGYSVAAADAACDGAADVLVGSPGVDAAGNDSGAAYLVAGGSLTGASNLTDAAATMTGVEAGDVAGTAVAAGDVTDDDVPDVLVGAPAADTGATDAGAAYLLRGECPSDGGPTVVNDTTETLGNDTNVTPTDENVTDADDVTDDAGNATNVTEPADDGVENETPTDGNVTDGNVTDGNVTDGNVTDGNETDEDGTVEARRSG